MADTAKASATELPAESDSAAITLPDASTFTFTLTTTSLVIDCLTLSDTVGAN